MEQLTQQKPTAFVDRRQTVSDTRVNGPERRQFRDSREGSSFEARELAEAIDQYKLLHRRRFITYEELYDVITDLGYHK
jgi:hypothetical protein